MKLNDIQKVGDSKEGDLNINYKEVVKKVFNPNVTELDDPDKVKAAWGV